MVNLEQQIQLAIEAARFEAAVPLIEQYGELVIELLRAAETPAQRDEIAHRASLFLNDRLHLARVMRSHLAGQLKHASRLISYINIPALESTWQVDA